MVNKPTSASRPLQTAARLALGLFMLLAGIAHLSFSRAEFQAVVPNWIPFSKDEVVVWSGIIEIGFGLALLFFSRFKTEIGLLLALFFILIFPGNLSQYTQGISAFGLDTDQKRLIRLLFQPLLIHWALWSTGGYSYLISKFKKS
jgi:uncharacterized membrane protein